MKWAKIEGSNNCEISETGLVMNLNTGKYIQPQEQLGYLRARIPGIRSPQLIHRLVAIAFIPNPENKPCVDHIDTDRKNNCVENLCWVTHKENQNNELTRKHMSEGSIGQPAWNKGLTTDTDTRLADYGKKVSKAKKGMQSTFKGKHHTEEAKEKNRKSHMGKPAWNKGLTKETDERVARYSQKLSKRNVL